MTTTALDPDATLILRSPAVVPTTPLLVVLPPIAPVQPERIAFFDVPAAPFCLKVRAILLWKGLAFDAQEPPRPAAWTQARKSGAGKVSALAIGNRVITESADIGTVLDRLYPARPLLPSGGRAAALCHAVTAWADESLDAVGLRYLWLEQHDATTAQSTLAVLGRGPLGRAITNFCRLLSSDQGSAQTTGHRTPLQIEQDLRRHLAHASALLADAPFVLGDEPWLCDFALFGQLAFLLQEPASGERVQQHPRLLDYVKRVNALNELCAH